MFKFIFSLIMIILFVPVSAETVYQKINSDGVVEFSDKSSENSKEIKIKKTSTYPAPRLPSLNSSNHKSKNRNRYTLSIKVPTNDAIIINKFNVTVSIFISPSLKANHQLRFQLGSQTIVSKQSSQLFSNVDRGTHNVRVSVIDNEGEIIAQSASISFYMKRFFKKPVKAKPAAK